MAQIAKTLVVLCVLIGWSKAFHITTEDEVIKDVQGLDLTPPLCRVVNASLDCPYPCGNATWEVTYIITDGNGSGINYHFSSLYNITETYIFTTNSELTVDQNGFKAKIVNYIGSCCLQDFRVTVVDNEDNRTRCPFNIKHAIRSSSRSFTTAISLWSGLIVMILNYMLI